MGASATRSRSVLRNSGADIVVADIDGEGAKTTGQEIEEKGRQSHRGPFDISDPESVEALFAAADEAFGQVDILVNVPFAFPERSRPHELSLAAWEKTLAVSLNGYFYCARQASVACWSREPAAHSEHRLHCQRKRAGQGELSLQRGQGGRRPVDAENWR